MVSQISDVGISDALEVQVVFLSGDTLCHLQVNSHTTVADLQRKLFQESGTPPPLQRLAVGHRLLGVGSDKLICFHDRSATPLLVTFCREETRALVYFGTGLAACAEDIAPKGRALGIRLGTNFFCMGVYKHGRVEILNNRDGIRNMLGCMAVTDANNLVGRPAWVLPGPSTQNVMQGAKRLIGCKYEDPVRGHLIKWPSWCARGVDGRPMIQVACAGKEEVWDAEEISVMLLAKLKGDAEAYLGSKVHDAVISVPAYFEDGQQQMIRDAARTCGLNVLRIIQEPTAAAIAYSLDSKSCSKRHVLVYRLGGESFDVTLLQIESGTFELLASVSNLHLGGEHFDDPLVNFCLQDFEDRNPGNSMVKIHKAVQRLRTQCKHAKHRLSRSRWTTIEIESFYNGIDYTCCLSRDQFEELNMADFCKTIDLVKQCLREGGVAKEDVHDVVLVGRSSQIPKVQDLLQELFDGIELHKSINPDEVAAVGAAMQAAHLTGHFDWDLEGLLFQEALPLSLGIETVGGLMTKIIERDTTVPSTMEGVFTTYAVGQLQVSIRIFQGERALVVDNHLLGEFHIPISMLAAPCTPRIRVVFGVDENWVLTVSAQEMTTGVWNQICIRNDTGGLSQHAINTAVHQGYLHKAEDDRLRRAVEARYLVETALADEVAGDSELFDDVLQNVIAGHLATEAD